MHIKSLPVLLAVITLSTTSLSVAQTGLPQEIYLTSSYTGVLWILGDEPGLAAGLSIASSDIIGDGYDDVIVGTKFADPRDKPNTGGLYIIFESHTITSTK